jgi:hypothetical protein
MQREECCLCLFRCLREFVPAGLDGQCSLAISVSTLYVSEHNEILIVFLGGKYVENVPHWRQRQELHGKDRRVWPSLLFRTSMCQYQGDKDFLGAYFHHIHTVGVGKLRNARSLWGLGLRTQLLLQYPLGPTLGKAT